MPAVPLPSASPRFGIPRRWAVAGGKVTPEAMADSVGRWLGAFPCPGLEARYLQEGRCAAVFLVGPRLALVVDKGRPGYDAHREFDLLAEQHRRRPGDVVEPLGKSWAGPLAAYTARFHPRAAECNLHCAALGSSFICVGYRLVAGAGSRAFWRRPTPAYFGPDDQQLLAREIVRLLAGTFDPTRRTAAALRSDAFFSGDFLFLDEGGGRFSLKLAALRQTRRVDAEDFVDSLIRLRVREGPMPAVWPFLAAEALVEGVAAAWGGQALPLAARALRRRGMALSAGQQRAARAGCLRPVARLREGFKASPSLEAGFWRTL